MHKVFLIIFLFIASGLFGASSLDSLIDAGLRQAYGFEFSKAENTFNYIIEKYPDNPAGYYHLSQIYLWYFLGSKDEGDLRVFQKFTELASEKTDKFLEKYGTKPAFLNILGNLYMQKAMAAAIEERTLDAFWATKKAYGYFEDALEIDSTNSKASLGLGLLEYALSYVPGMFKWAISLSGLGSDKEKGFRYILKARKYSDNSIAKTESAFHLSKILAEYAGDYKQSVVLLNGLVAKYPRNLLFRYQLSLALIEMRNLKEAEKNLQYIIENKHAKFIQTVAYSYFLIGEIYFKENEFNKAIRYYKMFLENSTGFDYSGIAYFNTALCYLALDNITEAKKNLLLARNGNTDIADDIYASKRSDVIFNNLLNDNQLKIMYANNYLQAGKYKDAEKMLVNSVESFYGEDKVKALLILGESCTFLKKYDEALSYFNRINLRSVKDEEWILPYYYYLNAYLNYNRGRYKKAVEDLREAHSQNSYDFRDKIEAKLNFLNKKLKSKK